VRALGASNFLVKCDAKVIKDHVEKESEAREPELVKYLAEVRKMERHFRGFTIEHLPRKNNGEADELAKKAARREAMPPDVFFEILTTPSTRPDKQPLSTVNAIASMDWRAPIIAFLRGHYEPVETHDLKRMQARAKGYILKDDIVGTCKACQFAAKHQRRPSAPSQLIMPTWPLQWWGMDIVGPLPTSQGNFKFAVVAIEYFTKWIEARPLAIITSTTIRKFF
jgi:hypothetical protein